MNAVEIEEAISELAAAPFDAADFPRAFLEAFNNKPTTVKRLLASAAKNSDVEGGVLQFKQIHLAVAPSGGVREKLEQLRASPKTAAGKVRFILATDGQTLEAEDLAEGDIRVCDYKDFANHFGFFLPLAGITTVKAIKNNPIDIQATGRLNRLYVELLKDNPDWDSEARRHDLNQFMARLIFCFFAEDTGIFRRANLFTHALETYSDKDNAHEIIGRLFRVMDLPTTDPRRKDLRPWEDDFPYVNGGLFAGSTEVPRFSRIARSYLLHAGSLDWKAINPDIFGSMIQAVADDDERGELGMHYTSVPNILKVLNPLFLDDLREQLEAAGDNPRKLLNLRKRLARIRVFDPACGSGNFLVIAYKEMRAIEAEILKRRNSDNDDPSSVIPLKNFFGIEIKDFACEIARLSLLIAEYQCDVNIMGQERAGEIILPLKETGRIVCGNALRLDWLEVCPPPKQPSLIEEDLAGPTGRFVLEAGDGGEWETYICGNPPYVGSLNRSKEQQDDMDAIFRSHTKTYKDLDYVAAWYFKAALLNQSYNADFAFVATKTVCQGAQVAMLWPLIFEVGLKIKFAHQPFHWRNLAASNAGVTCVIVGVSNRPGHVRWLFGADVKKQTQNIGPYLIEMPDIIVEKSSRALNGLPRMDYGNKPTDGGNFLMDSASVAELTHEFPEARKFIKKYVGSKEFIGGSLRYCLWIEDDDVPLALSLPPIQSRVANVTRIRSESKGTQANLNASTPHKFVFAPHKPGSAIIVPRVSSENRPFLPAGIVQGDVVVSDRAAVIYDASVWLLSILVSRLHLVWIATVCVRMRMDFSYSHTLGWNTFPVPKLTEKNKADLSRCAEDILLAREHYFPATIADMYDPDRMDEEFPLVRQAHERNDETLERIYIGRRFKNDTERLEKLFDLYTRMTKSKEDA
ncbi:MAG TPA: lactate dehydrogenase [Hyphomonas sp.]|nr:lactate dehydrogenase [Hyphomonas sp.]